MDKRQGIVTFGGKPVTLIGKEIKVGDQAPNFNALNMDLTPFTFSDLKGKIVVISVVPSVDTPVCDMQTRWFNQDAAKIDGLVIVSVSVDLPFALKKYCAAQGIETVKTVSDHKDLDFGLKYGFVIEELRLLARGTVVIDRQGIVKHVEYVPVISEQPNYDKVMEAVKACV